MVEIEEMRAIREKRQMEERSLGAELLRAYETGAQRVSEDDETDDEGAQ